MGDVFCRRAGARMCFGPFEGDDRLNKWGSSKTCFFLPRKAICLFTELSYSFYTKGLSIFN
jgi:hypothetical protein